MPHIVFRPLDPQSRRVVKLCAFGKRVKLCAESRGAGFRVAEGLSSERGGVPLGRDGGIGTASIVATRALAKYC